MKRLYVSDADAPSDASLGWHDAFERTRTRLREGNRLGRYRGVNREGLLQSSRPWDQEAFATHARAATDPSQRW